MEIPLKAKYLVQSPRQKTQAKRAPRSDNNPSKKPDLAKGRRRNGLSYTPQRDR